MSIHERTIIKSQLIQSQLHRSQWTFWLSLGFMLGVAQLTWAGGIVGALTILLYRRHKLLWLWVALVLVFLVGNWRYNHYLPDATTVPYDQTVTFKGQVIRPPRVGTKQRVTVRSEEWPGLVQVALGFYPPYHYGDVVEVSCQLQRPTPTPEFDYDKYLARYGILTECKYPTVHLLQTQQGTPAVALIYQFRTWLQQRVRQLYPEPVASVFSGVIIGIQDDLSAETNDLFRRTGTIHILVVSGMHVMIIVTLFNRVTQRWLSARRRFVVLIILLSAFSILTGLSASVIRAALMGLVMPLAQMLGRPRQAHITLALIAALMTAHNPYILLYDVGFQLSFLATLGLIYIQPAIERLFKWLPRWFWIRETVGTSVAAMIPTTPLILTQFGTFSAVSLLANIVVVPVSNAILFGGVASVLVSLGSIQVAQWFGYALWQVLRFTFTYLHWLLTWPQAYFQNLHFTGLAVAVTYSLLFIFMIWRAQRSTV